MPRQDAPKGAGCSWGITIMWSLSNSGAVYSKGTRVSKDHSKYYAVQPLNKAPSPQDVSSSPIRNGGLLFSGPLTPKNAISSAGAYFPMTQLLHSIFLKIAKYSNFISQHLLTMLVLLLKKKKNHSACTKTHAWPLSSFFHLPRQSEP